MATMLTTILCLLLRNYTKQKQSNKNFWTQTTFNWKPSLTLLLTRQI